MRQNSVTITHPCTNQAQRNDHDPAPHSQPREKLRIHPQQCSSLSDTGIREVISHLKGRDSRTYQHNFNSGAETVLCHMHGAKLSFLNVKRLMDNSTFSELVYDESTKQNNSSRSFTPILWA